MPWHQALLLAALVLTVSQYPLIGAESDGDSTGKAVEHAGLHLVLPEHWQRQKESISQTLAVWRAAEEDLGDTDQDFYARPSLAISQQGRKADEKWDEIVDDIREKLLDIYADVSIHHDESINVAGKSWWLLESSFQLGTITWRQRWLITLHSPQAETPPQLLSLVFSSSAEHWPHWHPSREAIEGSITFTDEKDSEQ